jgi:hypothetical protein
MWHHSLVPGDTRARAHPEIVCSVATDGNGLDAALLGSDACRVNAALRTTDTSRVDATLPSSAYVGATRVIAAFTAALSTARLLGHGLGWTKGDQGKQDRKCRHETSHSTLLFHLHSQVVLPAHGTSMIMWR